MSLGNGLRVARLGVSPCFSSWLEGFNLFSRWFEVVGSIFVAVRVTLFLRVGNWWRLTNFFPREWTFPVSVPQMFRTPSVRVRKRRKRLTTRKNLLKGFVRLFSRVWKNRMSSRNWKGKLFLLKGLVMVLFVFAKKDWNMKPTWSVAHALIRPTKPSKENAKKVLVVREPQTLGTRLTVTVWLEKVTWGTPKSLGIILRVTLVKKRFVGNCIFSMLQLDMAQLDTWFKPFGDEGSVLGFWKKLVSLSVKCVRRSNGRNHDQGLLLNRNPPSGPRLLVIWDLLSTPLQRWRTNFWLWLMKGHVSGLVGF